MNVRMLASSADPSEVALTVKGVGMALLPLIIMTLKAFNVSVAESDLANIVAAVSAAVAAIMILVGLVRKVLEAIIDSRR